MKNNAENAENAENAKFICKKCNFKCNKQSNWNTHISTNKHLDIKKDLPKPKSYICDCGNEYKYSSGLSKHRKVCNKKEQNTILENTFQEKPISENTSEYITKDMASEIIKQNNEFKEVMLNDFKQVMLNEFKQMMLDMVKNNNITNNTTNNTTNNANFNLNFFLNERCKDAVNIMDFINNIQIEFSDLENVGHRGYIEGVTQIILKHMNDMDIEKRPMHCTDVKRETIYIKNKDTWDKDNENKTKMKQLIEKIKEKNLNKLVQWREEYPECKDQKNKKYDFFIDIFSNLLGGREKNKLDEKIITNIAKNVLVDKSS